jgi:hypothetical protein
MAQCPVSWDYTAFQFALHESKLASGAWNSNNKPLESGDVISVDCGAFKTDTTVIMRILRDRRSSSRNKKTITSY